MKFLPLIVGAAMAWATVPALAAVGVPGSPIIVDYTLDFSGNICGTGANQACGNSSFIGQGYGDDAGFVDVSHRTLNAGTLTVYQDALQFWGAGYGGLDQAAWGGANGQGYIGEMAFNTVAGYQVTLQSLTFGNYQSSSTGSSFTVLDAGNGSVLFSSGAFNPGLTPSVFTPNVTSSKGLVLRWGPDAYNVGLGNVQFSVTSVTAVPEPHTWAMLAAGLCMLGTAARRRRRRQD